MSLPSMYQTEDWPLPPPTSHVLWCYDANETLALVLCILPKWNHPTGKGKCSHECNNRKPLVQVTPSTAAWSFRPSGPVSKHSGASTSPGYQKHRPAGLPGVFWDWQINTGPVSLSDSLYLTHSSGMAVCHDLGMMAKSLSGAPPPLLGPVLLFYTAYKELSIKFLYNTVLNTSTWKN